ncbi:MAG: hypothetical protein AAB675_01540 [Patescibacteria group bacterium]
MKKTIESQHGTSLLELIMFMAIGLLLFGFVTFNFVSFQQKTSISTSIDTLISDFSSQQTKAMIGAESSGTGNSYGVYFQSDRYILFAGSAYSGANPTNFTVMLDPNIIFTDITFPGSVLIFSQLSGEIAGFADGSNTIALQSSQGSEKKTLTINKYGVITEIN